MTEDGRPLTDDEVTAFVARMRATRTVPDVTDEALVALARSATRRRYTRGEVLFTADEKPECVYLIGSGRVDQITTAQTGSEHCIIAATEGYGIGDVPTLSGGLHLTTCRAMSDEALVDRIPTAVYQAFLSAHPGALAKILTVTSRRTFRVLLGRALARVLRGGAPYELAPLLDAFEAKSLKRGEALFRAGDPADGWYVVIAGRLAASLVGAEGEDKLIAETGAGEALGDLALLVGHPREVTVIATRDTTVARVKPEVFLAWVDQFPTLMRACFTSLVRRAQVLAQGGEVGKRNTTVFTLLKASQGASVAAFGEGLAKSLSRAGATLHVRPSTLEELHIVPNVRTSPPDHPCWLRAATWIEDAITTHRYVVLESDPACPAWESVAVHLADTLVGVAEPLEPLLPGLPRAEPGLDRRKVQARFLVILQKSEASAPEGAEQWVQALPDFRPLHLKRDSAEAFDRVARIMSGRAITLALGGGGARGLAHIGVLRAFRTLGIPVDVIGGTSMGSIIAAQYAMGLSPEEMVDVNRRLAASKPFGDYTIPMFALLRTRRIEKMAQDAFGERSIESLWLPYLACSANLATAELMVHERGPVWEATRASGALPGIAQPAVLAGQTLIDGGVLNNLPGDVLRDRFGGKVIAVNVSPKEERQFEVKSFPSPWAAMTRWFRSTALEAPNIVDIMTRAVTLTSARRARFVEREADLYLAPPIDGFGMLEFDRIEELELVGYTYALELLERRKAELV